MNKYSLILVLIGFLAFGAKAQHIEFASTSVDYGEIERGSNGVREFTFTNTGHAPLLITSAKGSCGCTVPTWPKEAIPAGASGTIEVKYDTNRLGAFTKYVTLTTNSDTNSTVRLTIRGVVKNTETTGGQ